MCADYTKQMMGNMKDSWGHFTQGNFGKSMEAWGVASKPLGGIAGAVAPKLTKKVNKGLQGIRESQYNVLDKVGSGGVANIS